MRFTEWHNKPTNGHYCHLQLRMPGQMSNKEKSNQNMIVVIKEKVTRKVVVIREGFLR